MEELQSLIVKLEIEVSKYDDHTDRTQTAFREGLEQAIELAQTMIEDLRH